MKKVGIVVVLFFIFIISVISGFIVKSFIDFYESKNNDDKNIIVLANETIKNDIVDIKEGIKSGRLIIKDNRVIKTSALDSKVSPNAEVVKTQVYEKCGHTRVTKEEAPREIINLNKDDVKNFYNKWNLDKFTANEICISKKSEGICDEHYILGESDGYVSISVKNDIGEYIFKGLTDISVQYLPQDDIDKLKNGIVVIGRENLNKFLEDYE